jgi:hypothetical protein
MDLLQKTKAENIFDPEIPQALEAEMRNDSDLR